MEDVDLGVCRGQLFVGDPDRYALIMPGARYVPAAPLLWFSREVLQSRGWSVLQVTDERTADDGPVKWVGQRLAAAVQRIGPRPQLVLVAKSLSTMAAPAALDRGWPAVWLTPLLRQTSIRSALAQIHHPQLVVGGSEDPTWDSDFAHSLDATVLEIDGADHSLQQPGDIAGSLAALGAYAATFDDWLARL